MAILCSEPAPRAEALAPTATGERLLVLDVLRGFALLGVLAVNMEYFRLPLLEVFSGQERFDGPADRLVAFWTASLAEGKFYLLFSMLFGAGFYMQTQRAAARDAPFKRIYVRRLLVLLAFGILHVLLLWYGDILGTYAVLGFVLLAFRELPTRAVLLWIGGLLLGVMVVMSGCAAISVVVLTTAPFSQPAQYPELLATWSERALQVYAHGSVAEIARQRLFDFLILSTAVLVSLPFILAMFLLGMLAARHGFLHDLPARRRVLLHVLAWGLPLGLAGSVFYAGWERAPSLMTVPLGIAAYAFGAPILALAYAAGIASLTLRPVWRRLLWPMAAAGRMALTNYLLQSAICTTIFYSYGLGLFGRIGPAQGLALSLSIYAAQLVISPLWLSAFRFGPMEWLWRSLTYGRRQPMWAVARDA
jgi:uncharacterized protein